MKCTICNKKAIYKYKEKKYCKEHFIEYFENKVIETIEKYKLFSNGERVGVAVSGGKDSLSLIYLLNKYKENLGIDVIGIHVDEGIKGYRDKLTEYLLKTSKKCGFEVKVYGFKNVFGITLDEAVKKSAKYKPCTICGVWRRWILNKASKELGVDKVATAHNLNDEAQTIVMNLIEGNIKELAKGGIVVGIKDFEGFVPRVKPFYFVTEKETLIYSIINEINPPWIECKYIQGQIRDFIRSLLYSLEVEREGTCENIVKNYIKILSKVKKSFKLPEIKKCQMCGEPSSREICRACEIKNNINSGIK